MNKELGSNYYDLAYTKNKVYQIDITAEKSPYSYLYNEVISLINIDERIIELGCGTGQFAEKLITNKYNYLRGIDFSEVAIKMAQDRTGHKEKFVCDNLYDYKIKDEYDVVISLEVMEHIQNDKKIIDRINKGSRLIMSVPSYMCKAHVRCFNSEEDIRQYYDNINIKDIIKSRRIWIINATL